MAFLLLLHQKMSLQRKVNKLTLAQTSIGRRKERISKRIEKVQKAYAKMFLNELFEAEKYINEALKLDYSSKNIILKAKILFKSEKFNELVKNGDIKLPDLSNLDKNAKNIELTKFFTNLGKDKKIEDIDINTNAVKASIFGPEWDDIFESLEIELNLATAPLGVALLDWPPVFE